MKYTFIKRLMLTLGVTACFLALTACQLTQKIVQPGEVLPTSEATPAEVEFGTGPFSLEDPTIGLPDLSSYKTTLILSFDGTRAGQPSHWSHTYVLLASQDPAARQVTIESQGGVPAPIHMVEANGTNYDIRDGNDCRTSTTGAGSSISANWEPAGFLSGLIGAEPAGSETINSVAADQYTFDERALGEAGFSQSTGQVWVASDKGYVVRYLLSTKAGSDYFGEGIDGTLTWEYNLTDINQPVTIEKPVGCSGGLVDAPLMPAARDIRQQPGYTIYSTSGTIQDGLAFYQEQLPALGWEATGEPLLADTLGWVSFVQGDQHLTVIVTPSENMIEIALLNESLTSPGVVP